MEQYSVLKTPGYAKYNGSLLQPNYSDTYGYKLTYYEPIYDVDLKIPGLGICEVPFIPIQHIRSNRGRRPFVPRHLTEQDMIQINLRAERKARDIMKDFHPAQKASYESARDFRTRKEIEERMESIRESCANIHDYSRKAEKYDFTRKTLYSPRATKSFVDKDNLKDIILDSKFEHIKDIKKSLAEDTDNHRAKFRLYSAACKKDTKVDKDERKVESEKEDTIGSELPSVPPSTQQPRKTSREVRADELKALEERIKKQESESDCFERTFGRHLSKLRGEVNTLTHLTDSYIEDTRYRSFKVDQVLRKY